LLILIIVKFRLFRENIASINHVTSIWSYYDM